MFTSGAIVMIVELIGSRILAPYFGSSVLVWTSLIGVVLLSLSLGYYLGGILVDRWPDKRLLSYCVFLGGIFIFLIPTISPPLFAVIAAWDFGLAYASCLAAVAVLFLPNIFLGTILPFISGLYIENNNHLGVKIGTIYALSTFGSIFGVFLAGYFLIPFFPTTATLYSLGLILIIFSLVLYLVDYVKILIMVVVATSIVFLSFSLTDKDNRVIAQTESSYSSLQVLETENQGEINRYLKANNIVQSAVCMNCEEKLHSTYRNYRLSFCYEPDIKNVLIIGGGGYSIATDLLENYDIDRLDVVEIDPKVTELAREYFMLKDDDRLHIFHQDGRMYINDYEGDKYDLVIMNAFLDSYSIPFHLTTIEAVEKINNMLTENGMVLVNMASAVEGADAKFFQAEYDTYNRVFPFIFVFPAAINAPDQVQNIFLLASAKKRVGGEACLSEYLSGYQPKMDWGKMVLEDNFAPVNSYLFNIYN